MPNGEILGFVAGAVVSFSYFPQIMRVFKLKSAHEISLLFTVLMLTGITLWLVYGIVFRLGPIILWNVVGALQAAALLYAKLRYGR